MKKTKKDIQIENLTHREQAGRILLGKMFCHLIELNKWMADSNKVERHYGSIESHIDFNNKMMETIRNRLKETRTITVTVNGV